MKVSVTLTLALALTLTVAMAAHDEYGRDCGTLEIETHMIQIYSRMITLAEENRALRAQMVRGGFHDCVPTVHSKPNSGCNGSLRNEMEVTANERLVEFMHTIKQVVKHEGECVSFADAILIAYAAAIKVAGGGSLILDLVDPSRPRFDSDGADFDSEGALTFPNPFSEDFEELYDFYKARKMTARDLVVSCMVGHSLGGISPDPLETGGVVVLPFTSGDNEIQPLYTGHLLWRHVTGAPDLEGFHTLPSDEALFRSNEGIDILSQYATFTEHPGSSTVSFSWINGGYERCLEDFRLFSIRMSQLSGDIMTGARFFDMSRASRPLLKETRGWDGPDNVEFRPRELYGSGTTEVDVEENSQTDLYQSWGDMGSDRGKRWFHRRGWRPPNNGRSGRGPGRRRGPPGNRNRDDPDGRRGRNRGDGRRNRGRGKGQGNGRGRDGGGGRRGGGGGGRRRGGGQGPRRNRDKGD